VRVGTLDVEKETNVQGQSGKRVRGGGRNDPSLALIRESRSQDNLSICGNGK